MITLCNPHITSESHDCTVHLPTQFMQDAQEVMGMLVKVQSDQGEMEPDDPQVCRSRSTPFTSTCTSFPLSLSLSPSRFPLSLPLVPPLPPSLLPSPFSPLSHSPSPPHSPLPQSSLPLSSSLSSFPHQVSYMISAWARMCKIIGRGFVQYLPVVMGPLIQVASIKPEIAIVDCMSLGRRYNRYGSQL